MLSLRMPEVGSVVRVPQARLEIVAVQKGSSHGREGGLLLRDAARGDHFAISQPAGDFEEAVVSTSDFDSSSVECLFERQTSTLVLTATWASGGLRVPECP